MKQAVVWISIILAIAVVGVGLCGCSVWQQLGKAPEEKPEAASEQKQNPERYSGHNFLFEIDRDWRRRHPEYAKRYGIIQYYDYDRNGICDSSEIIKITPANYPLNLVDFDKPYKLKERDMQEARERERDEAVQNLLDGISGPDEQKLEEETPEARRNKTKEQVIKKLLDDARKDDSK